MFVFADVRGWTLVGFALLVAFVPPLVLWLGVVAIGALDRRAGDVVFVVTAAVLVALVAVQQVKLAGVERRPLVAAAALVIAGAFVVALVRLPAVAMFTRWTAPLPAVAVVLFLLAPAGDLARGARAATAGADAPNDVAPVVFIMLDELPTSSLLGPDRTIDAVRYPNLAALADEATWYRDYTTLAAKTLQAVPSMLTGRLPTEDGSGLWTRHPETLFDLVVSTHELEVSEIATQLCGYSTCDLRNAGAGPGLPGALREMAGVWRQRVSLSPVAPPDLGQFQEDAEPLAPEYRRDAEAQWGVLSRPDRVTDFIESLNRSSGPTFHFLHLMLPHQPWIHYPDGTRYGDDDPLGSVSSPSAGSPDWYHVGREQRHLLQVQYTDRLLGEIFDTLRATGRWDESLIVVTADHGISFHSFPGREVNDVALPDVAYVPLIIKAPGQTEGRVDDTNLMGHDLLPTLADILGVPVTHEVDGLAAGDPRIAERGDRKEIHDFGDDFAASFQGVVEFDSSSRPTVESRWVGPIGPDDPPLAGLFTHLGVERFAGVDLATLPTVPGARARVDGLAEVQSTSGEKVLGDLEGWIEGAPDGTLLLALDGEIVSAAPVSRGEFHALLPPPDEDGTRGSLDLVLVEDDELHHLELVAG